MKEAPGHQPAGILYAGLEGPLPCRLSHAHPRAQTVRLCRQSQCLQNGRL